MKLSGIRHPGTVFQILLLALLSHQVFAEEKSDLLQRADLEFIEKQSSGLDLSDVLLIKDRLVETTASARVSQQEQVELVFSFSGETVTPTSLSLQVSGLKKDQASIEILVSESGSDSGYLSLRTEPIKARESAQKFTFEPAAAKWMMIKLASFGEELEFEISELEIEGYEGTPVSLYAFNEAPSDAIKVLDGLRQVGLDLEIHPDELALMEDAADGQLDSWSFAEASLISSGVLDESQRSDFLQQLDELTTQAEKLVASENGAFEKGRKLLDWLHKSTMSHGYVERQTDMSRILSESHYNCVSSATLYNIVARRLGLDARGIEVPDHAFTILYDGTDHVDVETTTPGGFDPARNRAAINSFARTTGFTYISDKHRGKRREIDDAGMVALTYYNHGVKATEDEDYANALLYYFRALSLDPDNNSAIKNTLVVLNRWSLRAIEEDRPRQAVEILDAALNFAPGDRQSRHNMRFVLSKAMQASGTPEETTKLVAFAQDLHNRTEDRTFLRLQSQVIQNKAYEFAKNGDYEAALQFTETLGPDADETTIRDLERLRISLFLNWSSSSIEAGEFELAMDVLDRGLKERPSDYRIKNNIVYTAQEWAASLSTNENPERSQALLMELTERFPDIRKLQRLSARNYDIDARNAFDAGDFETAITIYQTAQKLGVNKSSMSRNEKVVWNRWGLSLSDKGNFHGALAVFEKALIAHPRDSKFTNNVAYIVQEWGKSIAADDNILEAEKTIAVQRERFADVSKLNRMQGNYINNGVNNSKTPEEFESLEPILNGLGDLMPQKSRYDKLVAYFYQNWAKTAHPEFQDDESIVILQSGVDAHPDNRNVRKMFVYAVNSMGDEAMRSSDWERAISIFQSASRSLPSENTFKRKIKKASEQL